MNKTILKIVLTFIVVFGISSCGYDNYDEPGAKLVGNVQYKGTNVQVKGTGGTIQLQLYQTGYELTSPITVYVGQDGTFSAELFDGTYKMVTKDNNGPWVNTRDTTIVKLSGSAQVNLEVTPYFVLSDASCSISGNTVTVKFSLAKIVSSTSISYGTVAVGHTALIDEQNNDMSVKVGASNLQEGTNTLTFNVTDSQLATLKKNASKYNRVSVRVSVRSTDSNQSNYSDVVNLNL